MLAVSGARLLPGLLLIASAGCQCGHPGGDDGGIPCPESATRPSCCQGGCNGDLAAAAVCDADAGTWVCPAGSASADQCGTPFCAGDQPPPLCEKQLGVCAGSHHRKLPDGGIDPVCDYGPDGHVLQALSRSITASDIGVSGRSRGSAIGGSTCSLSGTTPAQNGSA